MPFNFDEEPEIHPSALKHLSKEDVLDAWYAVYESYERENEPNRWLSIGFCAKGSVELISIELEDRFLIIHALSPVQKSFLNEIDAIKRRQK